MVALLVDFLPSVAYMLIMVPSLALAIGLCDGLGSSRIEGYRDATLETLTIAVLLGLGLLPGVADVGPVS